MHCKANIKEDFLEEIAKLDKQTPKLQMPTNQEKMFQNSDPVYKNYITSSLVHYNEDPHCDMCILHLT